MLSLMGQDSLRATRSQISLQSLLLICLFRADDLLKSLLDTAQIKAGGELIVELTQTDIARLLEDTARDMSVLHGNQFELSVDVKDLGWRDQGLENLLSDAWSSAKRIAKRRSDKNRSSKLGRGLSLEEKERIFMPYHRGGAKFFASGWGLGLTFVWGVADAHAGEVNVSSSKEAGTVFCLHLPMDSRNHE